jgi:membrane-associated phospholipid phosphatase
LTCLLVLLSLSAGIDQRMYEGIHSGWSSPAMDATMSAATEFGDWYALGGSAAALYVSGGPELRNAAAVAACSWAGAMVALVGVRAAVNRPRPNDPAPGWLNSAFPSGHTTGYFAAATVYAAKFPRLAPTLGMLGAAVALSRVYFGHHWPSDVLAGAALGTGAGLLALHLEEPLGRLLRLRDSRVGVLLPSPGGGGLSIVTVRF